MAHDVGNFMPLYIADYLADTSHLSTLQHGAYLLLLLNYWRRGSKLPDNDAYLAQVTRLPVREWQKHREIIAQLFTVKDGWWIQKRVEEELARARSNFKSKSEAGAKGAAKRWQKNGGANGTAIAEPLPSQCQTDATLPSPSPSHSPSGENSDANASEARKPRSRKFRTPADWLPDEKDQAHAQDRGLSATTIAALAEQFRDHHLAKGTLHSDIHAAWRTWVGNHIAWHGTGPWPSAGARQAVAYRQGPASVVASAASALSRIEAKLRLQRDGSGDLEGEAGFGRSTSDGPEGGADGPIIDAITAPQ